MTGIGRSATITKAYINRAFSFLESEEYDPYAQYDNVNDPEQPNIKRTSSSSVQDAQTQVSTKPRYQRSNSDNTRRAEQLRSHKEYKYKNPNVISIQLDADEQSKKTNLRLSTGQSHEVPPSYDNRSFQASPVGSSFHSSKNSVSSYESLPAPLPPKMRPPPRARDSIPEDSPYVTNVSVISVQSGSDKTAELARGFGAIQPPKSWRATKTNDQSHVDGKIMTSRPMSSSTSNSTCMSRSRWMFLIVVLVLLVIVGTVVAIVYLVGKFFLHFIQTLRTLFPPSWWVMTVPIDWQLFYRH